MNFKASTPSDYKGFKLVKSIPLPELKCALHEYKHSKTGAEVLHIENDDPENIFCLSLQTLPHTSNGVAHILEHTVLCGSKRFPVKDPFFSMKRRSLNTFMNALTGSDFTCYPAASQVPKDFYNLLDVYLDAVFHPNLKELSFKQEGHRLEFTEPENKQTPLTIRGIVYNEMKGAMNSSTSRIHEALYHALFPDLTYGINSGGDPLEIPNLTYEELVMFHRTYYHPSRCIFYFYGNMPISGHLDFLEKNLLNAYEKAPPLPLIPPQARFTAPQHLATSYPVEAGEALEDKAVVAFGWLTCHILEQETCLALNILDIVLMDNDASPLQKALLKSGMCTQVASYVDSEINEVPFTIQLKGCNPQNADAIEKLLFDNLKAIAREGVPLEALDNAIHQLEFERSEISGDYYPFGLTLFMRSGPLKQHGGRPENGLLIHSLFEGIRVKVKENPRYFSDLIEQQFINNPHFVRIVSLPDPDLEQREQAFEKARLDALQSTMTEAQADKIVKDAKRLSEFQKKQEEVDINILPKVALEDIPKNCRHLELTQEKIGNIQVFHHTCFTNEIVYADIFFDMPALTKKELQYARLLSLMLPQVGCGGKGYEETLEYIQANTGGIGPYLTLHIQADDPARFAPAIALRGKALQRKVRKLLPLMTDMVFSPDFSDRGRIKEILSKHWTNLESGLSQNALKYALNLSAASQNMPSMIAQLWYGLDYYHVVRKLVKNFDKEWDEFFSSINQAKSKLLSSDEPHLVLSCDKENYAELKQHHFYGLTGVQTQTLKPWKCDLSLPQIESQGRTIASPVAFIGKVFKTVPYIHPDAPAINLAAYLFDNMTLHKSIREEGGAYGGGAVSNVLSGNFYFYSFRDPNIVSSLAAFEKSIDLVLRGQFDAQDLEEAKFEMIQQLDSPIAPGSRADAAYNWLREGKSELLRQTFRDRLLQTTCEDISRAVAAHIVPHYHEGATVVFASKELLTRENSKMESIGKPPLKILTVNA